VASITAHDAADPLDPGLPLGAARRALELPDTKLIETLITIPPAAGQLTLRDGRVRRAESDEPGLPGALREALDAVRAELANNPFAAPEAGRLAELGLGTRQLATLVRAGELTRIAEGIYLLPDAEQAAVEVLSGLGEPEFTLSTARQALGTSRRVAVPLLEWLARRGYTRRTPDGNHRLARRTGH
jgi:selenocysteine-specific elongation factor